MKLRRKQDSDEDLGNFETLLPGNENYRFVGFKKFSDYYLTAELQTKRWILRNLPKDGVFIDVGANVGILTACAAIKAVEGLIVSIEPTSTFDVLKRNLKSLNDQLSNIQLHNVALGENNGKHKDKLYKIWGEEPVEDIFDFKTLDSLVSELALKKINVVKIDTDGFELEVLKGASNTLRTHRPTVIVEVNEAMAIRQTSHQDLFQFMIDAKYDKALILDGHNYVFTTSWGPGKPWPNCLKIMTDREEMIFDSLGELIASENIKNLVPEFIENRIELVRGEKEVVFKGQIEQWAYAVKLNVFVNEILPGETILEIQGELLSGSVGFSATNATGNMFLSPEKALSQNGFFNIRIKVKNFENSLVLRPISSGSFEVKILSISAFSLGDIKLERIKNIKEIEVVSAATILKQIDPKFNVSLHNFIERSDSGYLMEQSTAHFLAAFYSAFRPAKHLEIGTWEGFGSALALENGASEVWSIEKYEKINPEYKSRYLGSKETFKPGWLVNQSHLDRFHQIFGDSTDIDLEVLELSFFDSVLIDGAHDYQSVSIDSEAAIKLTKIESIVLWDDFPIYESDINLPRVGVLKAIETMLPKLREVFQLYAVSGTSILIGFRKN